MTDKKNDAPTWSAARVAVAALIILMVGGGGYLVYRESTDLQLAEIVEIRVSEMEMLVTLRFNKYPEEGDRRDVRLRLESEVFPEDIDLDWREITQRNNDSASRWNREPPLGHIVRVHIHASEFRQEQFEGSPIIGATLEWAGRVVDTGRGEVTPIEPLPDPRLPSS
jgi:hypothetical protein